MKHRRSDTFPYIVETSAGCDRTLLVALADAYRFDGDRIWLALHPRLAPYKVGVFPVDEEARAHRVHGQSFPGSEKEFRATTDEAGSIGKRYRRQDEIGTPLGVTIDYDTLSNHTVTVRHRDSMVQERISSENLVRYIEDQFAKLEEMAVKRVRSFVYSFGGGKAAGAENMKDLLGGKGANLHGMTKLGLPVPPGFTISTEVCTYFYGHGKAYPKALEAQVKKALAQVEKQMDRKFGGRKSPLLVSVRSGARASMPGMMDTILNLGLNDETVQGLIDESGDARFSYDSYRRFITMYSDVVLEHSREPV